MICIINFFRLSKIFLSQKAGRIKETKSAFYRIIHTQSNEKRYSKIFTVTTTGALKKVYTAKLI